jgi:hypothetical protein
VRKERKDVEVGKGMLEWVGGKIIGVMICSQKSNGLTGYLLFHSNIEAPIQ